MFSGVEQFEPAAKIFEPDAPAAFVLFGDTVGNAVVHLQPDGTLMDADGDIQMVIAADVFESVLYQGEEEKRVDLLTIEIFVETGLQQEFFRGTGLRQQ